MFEQAITTTKIIKTARLTAKDLDKLIFYCGGEQAYPCLIIDNNALLPRDEMLDDLAKIRKVEILNRVFPDPKTGDIMAMVDELKGKSGNYSINHWTTPK